jgi:hypothetical protein
MLWSAGPNRLQPLSQAREGWHKVVMLRTSLVSAVFALWPPAMAEPVPGVSALAPSEIVVGAAAGEWTAIAPSDLRVMKLAPDAAGIHCCGMVGVGRNLPPDTGTGAELYTVIGHAPRHLDHNIALVGPVIEGIEHLSSLPRGTGDLGFYETAAERVPIVSVRLGDAVPALPRYKYLSTESASFAAYADARGNRRDAFFIQPAGGADICNVPVPVRRVK